MNVDLDKPFANLLSRQLAERRLATGLQYETCPRMLPVLGPGPPADLEAARKLLTETETISKPDVRQPAMAETISTEPAQTTERETISKLDAPRRGRPRKGAERETISAAKPWEAAGMSRAAWYRRRKSA